MCPEVQQNFADPPIHLLAKYANAERCFSRKGRLVESRDNGCATILVHRKVERHH
jgi:hypothetical protein